MMDSKLKLNQNKVKRFGLDEYFQQPELNQTPIQEEQVLGQIEDPNFDNVPDEYKQQYLDSLSQQTQDAGLQPIEQAVDNIPQAIPMDNSLDIPDYTGSNDTTGLGSVFGGRKERIKQLEKEQQQQESGYYDALENAYKREPQVSGGKIASALMLTLLPTILARTSGNKALLNASAETAPMTVKSINDLTAQDTARQQKLGLVQAERLGKQAQTTEQQLDRAVSAEERFNDQQLLMSQRDQFADGNRVARGNKEASPEDKARWKELDIARQKGLLTSEQKTEYDMLTKDLGMTEIFKTNTYNENSDIKQSWNQDVATGKVKKPLPDKQISALVDGKTFENYIDNALPEIEKAIKEGEGWASYQWKTLFPQEKLGRIKNQLSAAAAQLRGANGEVGVMTDQDFERYQAIIGSMNLDDPKSMMSKILEAKQLLNNSRKAFFSNYRLKYNTAPFEDLYGISFDDKATPESSSTTTGDVSVKKETKVVNGVTYEKVTGGWQKVKNG